MNYSQRYEKKFFINFTEEKKIKQKFDKIFELEFGQGYYCFSIYFDDFNLTTLKQKQEGTMERFKLRLRSYFFDLKIPYHFLPHSVKQVIKKQWQTYFAFCL